jgi:hypothetical protein
LGAGSRGRRLRRRRWRQAIDQTGRELQDERSVYRRDDAVQIHVTVLRAWQRGDEGRIELQNQCGIDGVDRLIAVHIPMPRRALARRDGTQRRPQQDNHHKAKRCSGGEDSNKDSASVHQVGLRLPAALRSGAMSP